MTTPRSDTGGAFPVFLEMGLGVDLVGEDATKAARRAVREAIGRTSLPGLRDLIPSGDRADMRVEATVAVPGHETVDRDAVAGESPTAGSRSCRWPVACAPRTAPAPGRARTT